MEVLPHRSLIAPPRSGPRQIGTSPLSSNPVCPTGKRRQAQVHAGKPDCASEHPAGRGGHDADSVLSSQELRPQLHRQAEDGPQGEM